MNVAVVLLNFGEPAHGEEAEVTAFLERIFLSNARLEHEPGDAARRRAGELARRRAPGLLDDYRRIGGSPLNARTEAQAEALRAELDRRGRDAVVVTGMQFTTPSIEDAVAAALEAGAGRLVALPLYPLCGPSTTVPALAELRAAAAALAPDVPVTGISGWHTAPGYTELRADGVRSYCEEVGLDLDAPGTRLVFSAHGTPLSYLREGSRYDVYVEDHCRRLGDALGVEYVVGYQNHANRPGVEWTRPAIEDVMEELDAETAVVVPVSFMQEQSETLNELDHQLRGVAAGRGLAFHRVPVPHDDARFARVLADLLAPVLDGTGAAPGYRACECARNGGAVCLNRDLVRPRSGAGSDRPRGAGRPPAAPPAAGR